MKQSIINVALVVRDYDEAIEFFCQKLKFNLVEDTYQPEQDKRWVVISPPGSNGTTLLLARVSSPEQDAAVGRQTMDVRIASHSQITPENPPAPGCAGRAGRIRRGARDLPSGFFRAAP